MSHSQAETSFSLSSIIYFFLKNYFLLHWERKGKKNNQVQKHYHFSMISFLICVSFNLPSLTMGKLLLHSTPCIYFTAPQFPYIHIYIYNIDASLLRCIVISLSFLQSYLHALYHTLSNVYGTGNSLLLVYFLVFSFLYLPIFLATQRPKNDAN